MHWKVDCLGVVNSQLSERIKVGVIADFISREDIVGDISEGRININKTKGCC